MNREIKFRAWNGEQMVFPDYIDRNGLAWWKENSIRTNSDKVMQFTGLTDRNGTEIYEGDIMQHANPFPTPFVVNWIDEECMFAFDNNNTSYVISDISFTVIGNIYEDLLD